MTDRTVAVAIVSKGRPEILDDTLQSVFRQTVKPSQVVVVVTCEGDLPLGDWGDAVQTIIGPTGITPQRNLAIDAISSAVDFVAFFDDDIELRPDYLEEALLLFERCPAVCRPFRQTSA